MSHNLLNNVDANIQSLHQKALIEVQQRVRNGPTQADCDSLARYLTNVFYPDTQTNAKIQQTHDNMLTTIKSAFEKEANRTISNFSMGSSDVQYTAISEDKIGQVAREAHEAFEHKTHIYRSTIEQRFQKIKTALENIRRAEDATRIEQTALAELNELYNLLNELRQLQGDSKGKIGLPPNSELLAQINYADALYQKLSYDTMFTPQDYGNILEYALNFLNYQTQIAKEGITDELIQEVAKTQGTQVLKQGKIFQPTTAKHTITIGKGKSKMVIDIQPYNPDAGGRQGKIDVELNWGDNNTVPRNFRISAKNWNKNMKDFGETQLGYALWRTLDDTGTRTYAHALGGNETVNDTVKKAHELAKLSIIADTVMGYSQKSNYADVLVINQRSAKTVVVISLKDYFEKLNLSTVKIGSYQEGRVHKDLKQIYTKYHNIKDYEDIALSYLMSNHKVRITYNEIIKNVDLTGQSS